MNYLYHATSPDGKIMIESEMKLEGTRAKDAHYDHALARDDAPVGVVYHYSSRSTLAKQNRSGSSSNIPLPMHR